MDLGVIAEGVETRAQLKFLQSRCCDEMQGYYLSCPLSVPEMEDFLREPDRSADVILEEALSQRTILLVDDDANTIKALQSILVQDGYHILHAACAKEGFNLLAENDVAVVVADYKMPEIDGSEFLKQVSRIFPSVIRIMISGDSNMQSVIKTINEGAIYKFLEKPVSGKILRDTLRQAFLRHEQIVYSKRIDQQDHEGLEAS